MAGVKGQVQQRGVERRRAIIDAAIELFSKSGYRGTGIAAVAEQAGVTPGGVLHHFGTKEGLLQAVIQERDARMVPKLLGLAAQGPKVALSKGMIRDAEETVNERGLAALYIVLEAENLSPDAAAHEFFLRRSRFVRRQLAETLRDGVRRGELRSDIDPDAKAVEITAFLEGAQLVWLLDPERIDLVALYKTYLKDLLGRIAVPDGDDPTEGW